MDETNSKSTRHGISSKPIRFVYYEQDHQCEKMRDTMACWQFEYIKCRTGCCIGYAEGYLRPVHTYWSTDN